MTQLASKSIDLPHNLSHTWLAGIKDDWTGRKKSSDSFLITYSKYWSSILPSFLPNWISIWWRLSSLEDSEMESVSRQVKHCKHHLILFISPDVKCIALLPFIINSSVWWLFSVIVSWCSIIRVIYSHCDNVAAQLYFWDWLSMMSIKFYSQFDCRCNLYSLNHGD